MRRTPAIAPLWLPLVFCLVANPSPAQPEARPGIDRPLVVATKEAPPFVIRSADGAWGGISIELWTRIAEQLGLEFRIEAHTIGELVDLLERGEVDVAVAPLTVTAERERRVDFTHPYFLTGLSIVVPRSGNTQLWTVLSGFASESFLESLGIVLTAVLTASLGIWLIERRRNPEQFSPGLLKGVGEGLWWATVTMTTVGYGDKSPRSPAGRLLAVVWMIAGVILISAFTATITSNLTLDSLATSISEPDDLVSMHIGTVDQTASASLLKRDGIPAELFPTIGAAIDALSTGKLEAVVYDEPILRHHLLTNPELKLSILPLVFHDRTYAFGLPPGSPLRDELNQALLETTARDAWRDFMDGMGM